MSHGESTEGERWERLSTTNHADDCGQALLPGPDTCDCPPPSEYIEIAAYESEHQARLEAERALRLKEEAREQVFWSWRESEKALREARSKLTETEGEVEFKKTALRNCRKAHLAAEARSESLQERVDGALKLVEGVANRSGFGDLIEAVRILKGQRENDQEVNMDGDQVEGDKVEGDKPVDAPPADDQGGDEAGSEDTGTDDE